MPFLMLRFVRVNQGAMNHCTSGCCCHWHAHTAGFSFPSVARVCVTATVEARSAIGRCGRCDFSRRVHHPSSLPSTFLLWSHIISKEVLQPLGFIVWKEFPSSLTEICRHPPSRKCHEFYKLNTSCYIQRVISLVSPFQWISLCRSVVGYCE